MTDTNDRYQVSASDGHTDQVSGQGLINATVVDTAPGSSATLRIDANSFFRKYIEQHTSKPAATNTLTVTLRPNFLVPKATAVSIFGLQGAMPVAAPIQLQGATAPFGRAPSPGTATWLSGVEGLLLHVRHELAAGQDQVFSFEVINPTDDQAAQTVSLQTRIPFIGPQTFLDTTGVAAAVFAADDRAFVKATISQSSCFPSAVNTITAEFSINFDVLHHDHDLSKLVLSISGLKSPNASVEVSPQGAIPVETTLSSPNAPSDLDVALQFERMGQWNEELGQLELQPSMSARGISSDITYRVSWTLTNPDKAQDPPPASGVSIQLSYSGGVGAAWDMSKVMTFSSDVLRFQGSVAGDAHPFKVYEAKFISPSAVQSSPWPRADNTITLTIVASVDISYPSFVTVSGLTGTDTEGSSIPVTLDTHDDLPEVPFLPNAEWNQGTGTIILKMKGCYFDATDNNVRVCYTLPAGTHQVCARL